MFLSAWETGLLKRMLQHLGTVINHFPGAKPTFQEEINASYQIQHLQLLSSATRQHDRLLLKRHIKLYKTSR